MLIKIDAQLFNVNFSSIKIKHDNADLEYSEMQS